MHSSLTHSSRLDGLSCSKCGKSYPIRELHTYASCCSKPIIASYSYDNQLLKEELKDRQQNMWRYREMLPILNDENIVSLGEGMTPLLHWKNLGSKYDLPNIYTKDEGQNPTGSFKARGLSMAISMAKEFGVKSCVIPTAGNAGGAMSAYCAKANMAATVIMPRDTPELFKKECEINGAELILIDGLINECGKISNTISKETGAFNMSTLKEPYRIEGKKTMGYEIAEQMSWNLPDIIIYPTGGGTGLIGIWRAIKEMIELGWVKGDKLPRIIAVQSELCAPVSDIFYKKENTSAYEMSIANGLSVPTVFGIDLIIDILNESKGAVVTVSEKEMKDGVYEIGSEEGICISPEGAAVWQALKKMRKNNMANTDDTVVLLNTGSGYKYLEHFL